MEAPQLQRWFDENLPGLGVHVATDAQRVHIGFMIVAQHEASTAEVGCMEPGSIEMLGLLRDLEGCVLRSIGLLTVQGSILGALMNEIRENHKCLTESKNEKAPGPTR